MKEGREDGLLQALKIAEKDGIEALRKEIRFRGATGIRTSLAAKDLDEASRKIKGPNHGLFYGLEHCNPS